MTEARKQRLHAEYRAVGVLTAPSPGGMGPPPSPLPALFDSTILGIPLGTHQSDTTCLDQFNASAEDMRVLFGIDPLDQTSMDLGG
jgi:hypothetical protein